MRAKPNNRFQPTCPPSVTRMKRPVRTHELTCGVTAKVIYKHKMKTTPIGLFKGSDLYSELLDSFSTKEKLIVDFNSSEISKAIYFHLCKMKHAGWKMRIDFKRSKKHTLSEFFQDLIAFYLKACLPKSYEIELEKKIGVTQPDIAIKKDGKYIFIIELKTSIGYERPDQESSDPFRKFRERIDVLSINFKVRKENVIYVFEDPGNVNKAFTEHFWDKKKNVSKTPPTEFPFNHIKPLTYSNDPYYWKHEKGFDRQNNYKPFNAIEVLRRAEQSIVTRFEDIIKQIWV